MHAWQSQSGGPPPDIHFWGPSLKSFRRKKVASALGIGGFVLLAGGSAWAQDVKVNVTGSEHQADRHGDCGADRDDHARGHPGVGPADDFRTSCARSPPTTTADLPVVHQRLLGLRLRGFAARPRAQQHAGPRERPPAWRISASPTTATRRTSTCQQIPFDAVDRIEILKDGASAIYGSDAVAGVVNVILRQQFTGITATATGGTNYNGEGNQYKAAITGGIGDLTKDKLQRLPDARLPEAGSQPDEQGQGLHREQRPDVHGAGRPACGESADHRHRRHEPGRQRAAGQSRRRAARRAPSRRCRGAIPPTSTTTDTVAGRSRIGSISCRQVERINVFARGAYNFTSEIQGYTELSYFQVKTDTRNTPTAQRAQLVQPGRQHGHFLGQYLPAGRPSGQPVQRYQPGGAASVRGRCARWPGLVLRDQHAALPRGGQGHDVGLGLGCRGPVHPQRDR